MYNLKYIPGQVYINGQLFGTLEQFRTYYSNLNSSIMKEGVYFELKDDTFCFINEEGHNIEAGSEFKIQPYQRLYSDIKKYAPLAKGTNLK